MIQSFLSYTDGINSPEIFRLWSAISTVAGALERRVWVETGRGAIYPNLYVMLIAPPGVGKSRAIDYVLDFWLASRELRVAPDSLTKAALVDAVADASRKIVIDPTTMVEFNSLLVPASELGVLLPSHDLEFLNTLNYIYDNPRYYRERRRHAKGDPIEITKPQLNIIGGTQPAYLASLLPEEAWGMGFMSRMLMIYATEPVDVPLFSEGNEENQAFFRCIADDIKGLVRLHGVFAWDEDVKAAIEKWVKDKCPPRPEHSKLSHYIARRPVHILKLMQVSSASRSDEMLITMDDFERAKTWLFEAEHYMPDIFKDMVYKSDTQVLQELHYYAWRIYAKERQPIHTSRLFKFLSAKVPSEKIERILDTADKADIVKRQAGTETWVPVSKMEGGFHG